MVDLTLEQQFTVASFNSSVDKMSEEQAKVFLKKLFLSYVAQELAYKELLKQQWGF